MLSDDTKNRICARTPFYLTSSSLIVMFAVLTSVWLISGKVDEQSLRTEENSREARNAASLAKNQSEQNGLDILSMNKTIEYMNASQTDFFVDRNLAFNETFKIFNDVLSGISETQNDTNTLVQQFNQTNESERAKAVQNIIDSIHADFLKLQNKTDMILSHLNKTG